MNFFNTDLIQFFWKTICLLVLIGIFIWLIKSALASWKRTNKITSIFDEIIIGIIVIVVFIIVVNNPLSTIVDKLLVPVKFILDMILKVITQITGMPL